MNLVEKIKQHWKVILICLLAMMWMSKCTTSCSRGKEIERQAKEITLLDSIITSKDSIIREREFELDKNNALLESAESHNINFTSMASSSQAELLKTIYNLTEENTTLKEENKRQKNLIKGLSDEAIILRSQVDSILRK